MSPQLDSFPPEARKAAGAKLSADLVERLRALKMIASKRVPSKVDCIAILEKVDKAQKAQAEKPAGPRKKKAGEGKAPGTERAAQIARMGSYRALQELREALADFLIEQFGVGPFLPVVKKGNRYYLATAWAVDESLYRLVSVVDDEERDVSGWNQERLDRNGLSQTIAESREFFEVARRRARTVRVWLPSIGIAVLFTPTGKSPDASSDRPGPVVFRGGHREYRCFPLTTLWKALKVVK
jgi:hypothetical protein